MEELLILFSKFLSLPMLSKNLNTEVCKSTISPLLRHECELWYISSYESIRS